MKCPKCGKPLHKDFCMYCGYMANGNIIDTKKKIEASKLEKYLGNDFVTIIHNENAKEIFILTVLTLLDVYIIYNSRVIAQTFLNTPLPNFYLNFDIPVMLITFLLSRLIYVMLSNEIYLKLLTKKLAKSKDDIVKLGDGNKVNVIFSIIFVISLFLLFYFLNY